MSETAKTSGVHHVGLTVRDVAAARAFFIDTLGFKLLGERPNYPAAFVSDGTTMLTLWQVADPATAAPFDRKSVVGLHHVALRVTDAATLDALHGTLRTTDGVEIEFPPEPLGDGPTRHMMFAIPGGIRLELIAPAA